MAENVKVAVRVRPFVSFMNKNIERDPYRVLLLFLSIRVHYYYLYVNDFLYWYVIDIGIRAAILAQG